MPLKNANSLFPFSDKFDILFNQNPGDFFQEIWTTKIKEVGRSKATLSMQDVGPQIWDPVFSKCCKILKSIENRSIKLKEVQNVTKCIKQQHNITEQLHQLHLALESCQGRSPPTTAPSWIAEAVEHIEFYLSLCKQVQSAKLVLCLRDKLKLSGKFDIIEAVTSKIDASVQEQPLSSIDFEVSTAVSFLEKLSSKIERSDSKQTFGDCLKTFCDCSDIVEWIKKEAKGMQCVFFIILPSFSMKDLLFLYLKFFFFWLI